MERQYAHKTRQFSTYCALAMPIRSSEFDSVAHWLEPILGEVQSNKLVVVTGPAGAGKSTLSRFLAWYFNVSLIEADYYLIPNRGFECAPEEVDRIIVQRHRIQRPVILEGATVFQLLEKISRVPDGIIQVRNSSASRRLTDDEMGALNPTMWGFDRCPTHEVVVAHAITRHCREPGA
jgi:Fe-S cluster assembly ATPase SufC